MQTKRMVILSLLLGAGITLYIVEAFYFPGLPIPGAKLGLTNIVTLLLLVLYGWRECIFNVVARTVIGSMITGTFLTPAFFFSFLGALASALIMIIVFAKFFGKLSLVGVSLAGAVTHNMTQMVLASFLLSHPGIFLETPLLILFAVLAGTFNGICANYAIKRALTLPKEILEIDIQDDKVVSWAKIQSASTESGI
jgi:heptaprenyl diphosphate synthase